MTTPLARPWSTYQSWHSLLKKECVYRHHFRTRAEATATIFESIEIFYNRQRLHGALGYRTPAEVEAESIASSRPLSGCLNS